MYRKEVNERSPMRVFERSIHGGLGRGKLGVIVARPGVGKTALLVQIALDDLMRERKVLHISHENTVEHIRAYYDEIFHDMAITHQLAQPQMVRLEIERNRLLYSHLEHASSGPMSRRGGSSSISRIEETVRFATQVADFKPDALIIDGLDFESATQDAITALHGLAERLDAEVWLSAKTEEYTHLDAPPPSSKLAPQSTPSPIRRLYDDINVIVLLQPEGDTVRLQLLKDHESEDLSELHLRLDPSTMRVIDEDLPARSVRPKQAARFHLYSGGARGAEATFGACAEKHGVQETHFSFEGHPFLERERGVSVLSEDDLRKGDFSLVYASHRLGRPLTKIPNIKRILQTVWHQISAANEVFVIGALQENGTVRGGTGWGAELARLWSKPVCVFDQEKGQWYRWDATQWRVDPAPTIERNAFAGIGTTNLTSEGRQAIWSLFERSFGASD